ncbi:pentapeptide repeat-containing protein [Phormidium sp. CLA17]|nr:pentapeptide repeat-containing protein [Leptolyngbya sp. Cla-17]
MALLLAPATLAGLGFLFQFSQEKAKRDKEEADKARDADQQREQALQTYFDQLAELLVDKQLKKSLPAKHATVIMDMPNAARTDANITTAAVTAKLELSIDTAAALDVVRARTLALLRMFDQDIPRKASVLSFLADTDLLNHLDLDLISIRLKGANLKKVNFSACKLQSANLHNACLSDANLLTANLSGADLSSANLSGADCRSANLWTANLSGANLFNAKLGGADLVDANLTNANLVVASLSGASLNGANLSGADLSGAYLWNANLTGDDLTQAKKAAVACIQSAKNWQQAQYSSGIRELLGLPQDPAKTQNTAI